MRRGDISEKNNDGDHAYKRIGTIFRYYYLIQVIVTSAFNLL
jgi:hypothetical protein